MKKFYSLLLFIFLYSLVNGQAWTKNLPSQKSKGELTLFDYQNAFQQYWAPFHLDKGYYIENGIKKKARGWKQFKRWEYDMQRQVNPRTGEFPKQTAEEIYEQYLLNHPQQRSSEQADWKSLGPNNSNGGYSGVGRINCIAFHPDDSNIYWVGAAAGGLWETTDNGSNWTCLTDQNGVLAVSNIIIPPDYAISNTIYIATGDRDGWDNRSVGVLKSTDGGLTWNNTGLSFSIYDAQMVNRLLMDPNNNQILIAATTRGVYKTIDGGTNWSQQLTPTEFIDMESQPGNFNTLYGSTKYGEIYVSTDGNTFGAPSYQDFNSTRIELAVSPNQPTWVYAVAANQDNGLYGIYKSENSGATFTQVFDGNTANLLTWAVDGSEAGGQGWYDLSLATSPTDANTLLVGGVNTWRSTDGGLNWSIVNHWSGDQVQDVHADKHYLSYRNNGDIFECNDGGVYVSHNNGTNWVDRTNGIVNSQMYRLSVSQTDADDIITGLQDNGTKVHSGSNWFDQIGGDGMECLIDYTDVNIQYGTLYYGSIYRTNDHWQNNVEVTAFNAGGGAWVTPYIIDPVNPEILYAGYGDVWQSIDRGDSWFQISFFNLSDKLQSMAVAPSDTRVLYVANYNQMWKTVDAGGNWVSITNNLPVNDGSIDYITVKNDDPNTIWVAIGGYSNAGVYESTDGGSTWNNISNGLPLIPAYSVVQNIQTTDVQLYVGTELGVYFKKGSDDWIPYNTGLPNVKTGEIEIYYAPDPTDSKLRVATFGRGLWETPVYFLSFPMAFISGTTAQKNTTTIAPGSNDQEIIRIELDTKGDLTPLSATSFTFNTSGTTDPSIDITNAKIYFTGLNNSFSEASQFGATLNSPNGIFTIDGSQTLKSGKNYFWLTYDVPSTANLGNTLDAQCTSVTIGNPQIPIVTDPAGNRIIRFDYCAAGADETTGEYISNVTMGAVNQNSDRGVGDYEDYTSQIIDIALGLNSTISVTNGSPYSEDQVLIWVDWNFDGDFNDADELVYDSGLSGVQTYITSFAPPASAVEGITRMRIRLHDTLHGPNDTPCGNSTWGEVEDYSLRIVSPDPCSSLNYLAFKAQSIPGDYVDLGSNGTVITTSQFDDANSDAQEIGFSFQYGCQSFSQFVLNTNGFIKLGNRPPSKANLFFANEQSTSGGIFNSTDPADVNLIIPFNMDLDAGASSAEYRVNTTGAAPNRICTIQYTDIREWATDPPPQYEKMQFQIKLYETTNVIEFVYGDWTPSGNSSVFKTAACGLKGADISDKQLLTVSKSEGQTWDHVHFANANYPPGNAFFFGQPDERPKPDLGRTFRFIPMKQNDLSVRTIYSLGDASYYFSSPQFLAVNVMNAGSDSHSDIPVTLNITGSNNFTETKNIFHLGFSENATLTFSDFAPANPGNSTIAISVGDDDDNADNSTSWIQNTNNFYCNYSSSEGPASSQGVDANQDQIVYARYHVTGLAKVVAVTAYIANDAASVGQIVYGVILKNVGIIAAESDHDTIQVGDLGSWHTFTITLPPSLTDADFYAGLAMTAAPNSYSPLGVQDESPSRDSTYFYSNIDGTRLKMQNTFLFPYRYMIGALLEAIPPVPGFASSNSPVCDGSPATLNLIGFTGNIQWQDSPDGNTNWNNVIGGTGANTSHYISENLSATTYYRAEVVTSTFSPVYSNITSVEVELVPAEAGEITGESGFCQNHDAVYSVPDIDNAVSYIWTLPFGASGSSTTNSIEVHFGMSSVSGNITVKGKNTLCTGVASSFPVIVNPQPTTPLIGTISHPNCTIPTGSVVVNGLPPSGMWTITIIPDGTQVMGTGTSKTVTGLAPGTYSFYVTHEGGCVSDTSADAVIHQQPPTPPTPVITETDSVLHSDAATGNQWYDQDGIIPGATSQDFTATIDGEYYVIVTLNGCKSDTSNIITINTTATIPIENNSIKVYPNPVSNELIIELTGNTKFVPFEILNSLGQMVFHGDVLEKTIVRTNNLSNGVYMVKIRNAGIWEVRKVVKE